MNVVRHACFISCFQYCQGTPTGSEKWISFFLLSFLSAYVPIAEAQLQSRLELLQFLRDHKLHSAHGKYYTPGYENVSTCTNETLLCYILEMQVMMYEEDAKSEHLLDLMKLHIQENSLSMRQCLPCEAYEEKDSKTFVENFRTFVQRLLNEAS
ncbi:hypothetical protein MATL_G00194300 [Megalops atlanticus]|uniref:Interleukin n=1 Tax=Megalops atlanticus TaxID=7932 RepID=A0A9D3PJG3_MEGAT|nr:hypothetical protein MATL_G00194300 [Megalops atlanticus]